jgi:hypothetical protein
MDSVSDTEAAGSFERDARAVLEYGLMHVDARVRSRLNQARQAALAEVGARREARWLTWGLMPATGAAAAAVVVALLLHAGPRTLPVSESPASAMDVLDLVTDDDALALMQDDDQAFYEWAAAQGDTGAAGAGGAGA